jgi:hypothetical protein
LDDVFIIIALPDGGAGVLREMLICFVVADLNPRMMAPMVWDGDLNVDS